MLVVVLLLSVSATPWVHAQAECESQTFQTVLSRVGNACADLERNSVCYGNNAVNVAFWTDDEQPQFAAPGDLVPTEIVERIETSRYIADQDLWGVALMRIQANIPNTLPGQAVTFLLMGDVEVANDVTPEAVAAPVDPIPAVTRAPSNLRSAPTTNALVRRSVNAGTPLALIGRSSGGLWYEIETADGLPTWVFAELVEPAAPVGPLPVTGGPGVPPRYGPMQAFYFTAGIGNPQCREAPEAMVVQSPDGYTVRLTINNLDITLGSTIVVIQSETTNGRPVLGLLLVDGTLTVQAGGRIVTATAFADEAPGTPQVLALETDADGRVLPGAELLPADMLDMDDILARLGNIADVLAGDNGLEIALAGNLTTETLTTLDLTVVEQPQVLLMAEPNPTIPPSDIAPPTFSNLDPPASSGGGGSSSSDGYGYGSWLPNDNLTIRQTDAASHQRGQLMGMGMLLVVGMIGVFSIFEGRRPRDDA